MGFAGFVALVVGLGDRTGRAGMGRSARPALGSSSHRHGGGGLPRVVREFLATFSNEKFVVPICSAMGFAYVLRHTGCERHLVLLLVKPLRYVRWFLVPGVIAVGFLVNIPVISQTSTAVCIGPVVVPLMRRRVFDGDDRRVPATRSVGRRGAAQPRRTGVADDFHANPENPRATPQSQAAEYLPPLVFTQLAVSMMVFWAMSMWWERKAPGA